MDSLPFFTLIWSQKCQSCIETIKLIKSMGLETTIKFININNLKQIPQGLTHVPSIIVSNSFGQITDIVGPTKINFLLKTIQQNVAHINKFHQYAKLDNIEKTIYQDISQPMSNRRLNKGAKQLGQKCLVIDLIQRKGNGIINVYSAKDGEGTVIGTTLDYSLNK